MTVFTKAGQQIFAPVDENGNARTVSNQEVQVWSTEVEAEMENYSETIAEVDAIINGVSQSRGILHRVAARMAAGETIKIACFGDSTTDGNNTTGWTANPTSGGDAVGSVNHNLDAPNSWPVVLETILHSMYGSNASVWNAGYSGQELQDGWAVANYEAAVIDNPFYGVPDLVFVGFGLNDVQDSGSQITGFETQMRALIKLIVSHGSIPVFLTCDPAPIFTNGRDNRETTRQIDEIKRAVCDDLGILLLDSGAALDAWASRNNDGYRWQNVQSDYLHFNDAGHALKAGFVAKHLFPDVTHVAKRERAPISPFASRSNSGHDAGDYAPFVYSLTKFGGNWNFTIGALAAGAAAIDAWVWNENPEATVVYRGVDANGDVAFPAGTSDVNMYQASVYSPIKGTETAVLTSSGFARTSLYYRRSDMPAVIAALPWGLSRIRFTIGDAMGAASGNVGQGYIGWLDVMPFDYRKGKDALKNQGRFARIASNGAVNRIEVMPEDEDGSNVWGCRGKNAVDIYATVTLPVGCGFIFGHNQAFASSSSGHVAGDKSFSFIYRSASTSLRVYNGRTVGGVLDYSTALGTGTISSSATYSFRIRIVRTGDNQVVTVYENSAPNTAIVTVTIAYTADSWLVFGGAAGGLFFNESAITGTVFAEIQALTIVQQ